MNSLLSVGGLFIWELGFVAIITIGIHEMFTSKELDSLDKLGLFLGVTLCMCLMHFGYWSWLQTGVI